MDLCFVPATHEAASRLPAVSGSSGRLVLCGRRAQEATEEPTWPGRVFEDLGVDYEDAMQTFVAASAARLTILNPAQEQRRQQGASPDWAAQRALRREERLLGQQRGQVYQHRRQEDAAWRTACHEWRNRTPAAQSWPTREERAVRQAQEAQWRALWAERHATLERRRHGDAIWRQERRRLREQLPPLVSKWAWIAILVVTDNCTRQCLGLPLFVAGPKITAALVITALRALLPAHLQFLISDRGTHFTARDFARFADARGFVHVLVAHHRPQSNGIAERFVRTLKEWLAAHAWADTDDLELLLDAFLHEYNGRPHQGLALPGLSPDEFARRLWLL